MPAFEAAVALGYRYVETDVHVTADGILLAFHDDRLDRVTNGTGLIADLPWREVRLARVGGREPIPLLEDLLATWPDLRVNIDPKHDGAIDSLVDVLRRTASMDRVCLGAFSDHRLTRLRRVLGPDVCMSLGPKATARLRVASVRVPVGRLPGACAQVPHKFKGLTVVDRWLVHAAHRRGLQVHVWTIDDADEMEQLLNLGVDGIMTDRPAVLRRVLERRGQWFGN